MKEHTLIGASMLDKLEHYKDEKMIKIAYQICRWHHERYDGRGYPDGLKGDEIPISAQVVSLADVYDALVGERVYKKAYSHEKAIQMILNGECGTFNPLLLECLKDIQGRLKEEMTTMSEERAETADSGSATSEFEGYEKTKEQQSTDGTLYCAGMIAGEGLVGILLAIFAVFGINTSIGDSVNFGNIGWVILMVLKYASLFYFSLKKKKKA